MIIFKGICSHRGLVFWSLTSGGDDFPPDDLPWVGVPVCSLRLLATMTLVLPGLAYHSCWVLAVFAAGELSWGSGLGLVP